MVEIATCQCDEPYCGLPNRCGYRITGEDLLCDPCRARHAYIKRLWRLKASKP